LPDPASSGAPSFAPLRRVGCKPLAPPRSPSHRLAGSKPLLIRRDPDHILRCASTDRLTCRVETESTSLRLVPLPKLQRNHNSSVLKSCKLSLVFKISTKRSGSNWFVWKIMQKSIGGGDTTHAIINSTFQSDQPPLHPTLRNPGSPDSSDHPNLSRPFLRPGPHPTQVKP
jgi:hypothetical protein